jgi:hypothetical protein
MCKTTESTERHYWRCADCLLPLVLPVSTLEAARCGNCNGTRLEWLGKVKGGHAVKTADECVCDENCVHARGPKCGCKCGGRNHGIGMAGYVTVVKGITVVRPPASDEALAKAAHRAAEYRDAHERLTAEYYGWCKGRSGWVPDAVYNAKADCYHGLKQAAKRRGHKSRMADLDRVEQGMVVLRQQPPAPKPAPPARRDGVLMTARFPGWCRKTGRKVRPGDRILFFPASRAVELTA